MQHRRQLFKKKNQQSESLNSGTIVGLGYMKWFSEPCSSLLGISLSITGRLVVF